MQSVVVNCFECKGYGRSLHIIEHPPYLSRSFDKTCSRCKGKGLIAVWVDELTWLGLALDPTLIWRNDNDG